MPRSPDAAAPPPDFALERPAGGAATAPRPAEAFWFVEAGRVEVFAVPRGEAGPRLHLTGVEANGLLCALDPPADAELALLPVPSPDARWRPLRPSDAELLEAEGGSLAAAVEAWLAGLCATLDLAKRPRSFEALSPGREGSWGEAGGAARAAEGVVWLRPRGGTFALLGDGEWTLAEGELSPLPEALWLTVPGPGHCAVLSTEEVRNRGELEPALSRFQARLLASVARQRRRAEVADRERLALRQERDQARLRGAYARLAAILPGAGTAPGERGDGDPLLLACRRVGRALGVEIRDRPEGQPADRLGDRLTQICRASRVRSRRVILRDDWWRRDNGPLIAFRAAEGDPSTRRPVALLPVSVRAYEIVEAGGERQQVDAALAESLSGEAYMLYPALPTRRVGLRDLARMAFAGRERDFLRIALTGLAGGLLGLLLPVLTGQLFGGAIPAADRGQLLQITLALLVAALAGGLFQVVRSLAVLRIGGKVDGAVQAAVIDRLLALPVAFFRRYSVGDLANRALGIDAIRGLVTGNVLTLALAAVFSSLSFALLFYYSWRLALLATALAALLAGVTATLAWVQLRHQRVVLDIQGRIESLLFGLIHGIAKLRVAGAETRAYARWAERFAEQRRAALSAQRSANVQTTFNAVYSVLTSLGIFAMVGFSTRGTLPVGDFLAFHAAFGQFLSSVLSIVSVFSGVLSAVPLYERLRPILEAVPEMDESKAEPGELAGDIEFSHVSFRYQADGHPVLEDVSFRASAGEFIALVGPSGAGKSTCLRLILGFERPSSGSIYFDSQDLAGLAVQSVRRQIGVVLQSGRPMAGSLFSNIVGSANLGIDDAWEAARAVGLEADIQAMPMGMHTVVSEGAETFSGGQKQRILIARAIVNRPRILLFDEATSALDNRTQEIVSRSLEGLKATRVVIAHRLSTIRRADRIYVIEGGRVVEVGSYDELIVRDGPFARLARRQIA